MQPGRRQSRRFHHYLRRIQSHEIENHSLNHENEEKQLQFYNKDKKVLNTERMQTRFPSPMLHAGADHWNVVDNIVSVLGDIHVIGSRWILGWASTRMRLSFYEVCFLASHSVSVCLEASGLGMQGLDWEIWVCALFQTFSYFTDHRFGFESWCRLSSLKPDASRTLIKLMNTRGWMTRVCDHHFEVQLGSYC